MRIKGISWIEQHFEKLVAGLFGLALMGVLAWQFGGPKETVKVGNEQVPLDQTIDKLGEVARGAKGRLSQSEPPSMEGADKIRAEIAAAEKALAGHIAPTPTLPAPLDEAVAIRAEAVENRGNGGAAGAAAQYAAIAIPAPAQPTAAANLSTISPIEMRTPEVASLVMGGASGDLSAATLTSRSPDLASVSVETTFSGANLKAMLQQDPDGDGPLVAMPNYLWETGVEILVVEAERQELGADGQWGAPTPVKPMPGRWSLAAEASKQMGGVQQLQAVIKTAHERARDVRRPDYYQLFQGRDWKPPTESEKSGPTADAAVIDRLKKEYRSIEKRKKDAEGELAKLPAAPAPGTTPPSTPPPRRDAGGGGGGGGIGGGGRGPGGGGGTRPPAGTPGELTPQQIQSKRRNLESQIENLTRQMSRVLDELKKTGADVSDLMAVDPNAAPIEPTDPANRSADPMLLEDPAARLWLHDVFVDRGKTYRYRVRLVVSNPLFQQFTKLAGSQEDLAKPPILRSAFSEWSSPVTVEADRYFFVVGANTPDGLTRTSGARVELYTFSWGYWRKAATQIEPGDRIVATAKGVPNFAETYAKLLAVPANPDNPSVPPSVPAPQEPGAPGAAAPAVPTRDVEIALDWTLLAVGIDPSDSGGSGRQRLLTFFRDNQGRVQDRNPDADAASKDLELRRRSAEEGLTALKPKPVAEPNPGAPAPGPGGREPAPSTAPGLGGGGRRGG